MLAKESNMKKTSILGILLLSLSCGDGVDQSDIVVEKSRQALTTSFESTFKWGTLNPGTSKSSTTGPGPEDNHLTITCYTEALPAGITYSCLSPAPGAIEMVVSNNNNYPVELGTKWHGAKY